MLTHKQEHAQYIKDINKAIGIITQGLTMDDFGDTVFTYDAMDAGELASDTAREILENDCIGSQFLELFDSGGE